MKKLFGGVTGGLASRKKSEEEDQANTLDRLVRDKEGVRKKLEEEEREFVQRKREYVNNIIIIEQQEIERRERELESKKNDLKEKKRLNQQVKDKFLEQMKLLEKKLEETKEEHSRVEAEMESEISVLEDKLGQVRFSLNEKMGEVMEEPSAPEADRDLTALYPDLQMFRSSSALNMRAGNNAGSTGSSPQISIISTTSANSRKSDSD